MNTTANAITTTPALSSHHHHIKTARMARQDRHKTSSRHDTRHRRAGPILKIAPAPPNPTKKLLVSDNGTEAKGRLGSMSFNRLIPGEHPSGVVGHLQSDSRHVPMLHAAQCLLHLGMLDGLRRHDALSDTQHVYYKARVLESVIERLAAERTAVSEATINALIYLIHYELSQGSEDAKIHLQGIHRVTSLRKDMETHETLAFVAPLELGDMIHALMFEAPLEFARHQYPKMDPLLDTPDKTTFIAHHARPALTAELRSLVRTGNPAGINVTKQRPVIAARGTELMSLVMRSDRATLAGWQPVFDEFEHEIQDFLQLAGDEAILRPTDSIFLAQASSRSQAIMYSWVVQQRALRSDHHQANVRALANACNKMTSAGWEHSPFTRMFVLFTGISAATNKVLKSQLETQLVQTIVRLGDAEWHRVKAYFIGYLNNKQAAMTKMEPP